MGEMTLILMIITGLVGAIFAICYLINALHYKKHGKDKKAISEELIELLKE